MTDLTSVSRTFALRPPRRRYQNTAVTQRLRPDGTGTDWVVTPTQTQYTFRTKKAVPKLGCASQDTRLRPWYRVTCAVHLTQCHAAQCHACRLGWEQRHDCDRGHNRE